VESFEKFSFLSSICLVAVELDDLDLLNVSRWVCGLLVQFHGLFIGVSSVVVWEVWEWRWEVV